MISFACDKCGKVSKAPEEYAGRSGKCRQCGEVLVVPRPATFEVEATEPAAPPPRPRIVPTPSGDLVDPVPILTPAPPVAVQQSVALVMPTEPKPANALGVASVIVGALALCLCWAPLINLATIPLAFLGGLLAAVGALVAATSKRTGYLWPALGAGMNFGAVLIMVAANLMFAAAGAKVARELDRAIKAMPPPQARPARAQPPGP